MTRMVSSEKQVEHMGGGISSASSLEKQVKAFFFLEVSVTCLATLMAANVSFDMLVATAANHLVIGDHTQKTPSTE